MRSSIGLGLFDLTGRTAIVTGSTRGIGLAIARQLGSAGANVVVSSEDADDTGRVAAQLAEEGLRVAGKVCDVAEPAALRELVGFALKEFGALGILVCNAGITGRRGAMADLEEDDYRRVFAVNLDAAVRLANIALPHIADWGGGAAVMMSSISGLRGNRSINAYALSKAALAQAARNFAIEWGASGVRVNAVSPGLIRTAISEPLLADAGFRERRMRMTPLRRAGTPSRWPERSIFLFPRPGRSLPAIISLWTAGL